MPLPQRAYRVDIRKPPPLPMNGTWVRTEGGALVIGATCRSPHAVLLGVFVCAWQVMMVALITTPSAPGDSAAGCVLLPFTAATLWVDWLLLLYCFGRTEVSVQGDNCSVFTGIGSLGWRRRFRRSDVQDVRNHIDRRSRGGETHSVLIEADRDIKLGRCLSSDRQYWMLATLTSAFLSGPAADERLTDAHAR